MKLIQSLTSMLVCAVTLTTHMAQAQEATKNTAPAPTSSPTVRRADIDSSVKENKPETFLGDWHVYQPLMIDVGTPETGIESQVGLARTETDPILKFVIPKECKSPGSAILSDAKVITVSKGSSAETVHLTFKKLGNKLFECEVLATTAPSPAKQAAKPATQAKISVVAVLKSVN